MSVFSLADSAERGDYRVTDHGGGGDARSAVGEGGARVSRQHDLQRLRRALWAVSGDSLSGSDCIAGAGACTADANNGCICIVVLKNKLVACVNEYNYVFLTSLLARYAQFHTRTIHAFRCV